MVLGEYTVGGGDSILERQVAGVSDILVYPGKRFVLNSFSLPPPPPHTHTLSVLRTLYLVSSTFQCQLQKIQILISKPRKLIFKHLLVFFPIIFTFTFSKGYESTNPLVHDIALVQLDRAIALDNYPQIGLACLPHPDILYRNTGAWDCFTVGWKGKAGVSFGFLLHFKKLEFVLH